MKTPRCALCFPCYNEADLLPHVVYRIADKLHELIAKGFAESSSFILFVDDGSRDSTWSLIAKYAEEMDCVRGIKLAHNVGHQNAVACAMMYAKDHADCSITMDVDLQDDIAAIDRMLEKYRDEGCEVVFGVRNDRGADSWFKRATANSFYGVMKRLGVESIPNHADFRLVGLNALNAFAQFEERGLYLRGIFPLIGFKNATVEYARRTREYGESKYPLSKMIALAKSGIVSSSSVPLRIVSRFSAFSFLFAIGLVCYIIAMKLSGRTVEGWASIGAISAFLGAIQLLSLSIIGEYVAAIYGEAKRRPRYIVERVVE